MVNVLNYIWLLFCKNDFPFKDQGTYGNFFKLNLITICKLLIPAEAKEPVINFLKLNLIILGKMLITS